jgi:hypothetical protein
MIQTASRLHFFNMNRHSLLPHIQKGEDAHIPFFYQRFLENLRLVCCHLGNTVALMGEAYIIETILLTAIYWNGECKIAGEVGIAVLS